MSAKHFALITTVGADRPGIVEKISGWILEQRGNIEDSRMSQLGGEFATLILVSGDDAIAQRLDATHGAFAQSTGLTVFTRAVAGIPPVPGQPVLRYQLRATSLDNPGIVHQVATLLSRYGVNIVSATTQSASAPFSGAPVFQIQMLIDIPGSVSATRLRQELEELGIRLNIDFLLEAE